MGAVQGEEVGVIVDGVGYDDYFLRFDITRKRDTVYGLGGWKLMAMTR